MGRLRSASALAVLGILAAGCGTVSASTSTTAQASTPAASQAANVLVCRHYVKQRAWVKGLTMPTMGDALKFAGYVAADSAETQPGTPLARDLNTMYQDQRHLRTSRGVSARVLADCRALGVTA